MKLHFNNPSSFQADPYVIKANGSYYLYSTGVDGIQVYRSEDKVDWNYLGICYLRDGYEEYWAPCVLFHDGDYFIYFSMKKIADGQHSEGLFVAKSPKPEGPFTLLNAVLPPFSIDPHVVRSGSSLYLFYSDNVTGGSKDGTVISLVKMASPTEIEGPSRIVLRPSIKEEIFMKDRFRKGRDWYTVEGPFYFRQGNWHYLMYSGSCYQNKTYFIGYATAYGDEDDLRLLDFKKHPSELVYDPLISSDEEEEGTGHNSVLEENGNYYVYYHGRDLTKSDRDSRTARVGLLKANDGTLKVERKGFCF